MGRLSTEQICLRLTSEQKEKLKERAEKARMNMSQYLLALSDQKKIIVIDEVPELVRQIIKIGTNVNQIAIVVNTNHMVSDKQLKLVNYNLHKIQIILGDLINKVNNSKDEIEL